MDMKASALPAPSLRSLRLFATSWTILCAGAAIFLRGKNPDLVVWPWFLLTASGFACGIFSPHTLRRVYAIVERLLAPVGRAGSLLMLGLVYFILFTIYAQLLRLLGRDALLLRLANQTESGWHLRKRDSAPHQYYRQF